MALKQHREEYATTAFRTFPYFTTDPEDTPDKHDLPTYVKRAMFKECAMGSRIRPNADARVIPDPFSCAKSGRTYRHAENWQLHLKELAPYYGSDFQKFQGPHDEWNFSRKDKLNVHHKVLAQERREANELKLRLSMYNNQDQNDIGGMLAAGENFPQQYIDGKVKLERLKEALKAEIEREEIKQEEMWKMRNKPNPYFPDNYDLLPKVELKPKANYTGWSRNRGSDSWFSDKKTESVYDSFIDFYVRNMAPKTFEV